jgi:hypothetical protein
MLRVFHVADVLVLGRSPGPDGHDAVLDKILTTTTSTEIGNEITGSRAGVQRLEHAGGQRIFDGADHPFIVDGAVGGLLERQCGFVGEATAVVCRFQLGLA